MQQLQAFSYQQILPQMQNDSGDQQVKTGDTSFFDMMTSIQKELESPHTEENPSDEKVQYAKKVEDSEETQEKEEEKSQIRDAQASQNLVYYQIESQEQKIPVSYAQNSDSDYLQLPQENLVPEVEIDQVQQNIVSMDEMNWLLAKEDVADSKKELTEELDFSALIDNAVEYVPGSETEDEKLDKAQNLAILDPQKFLKDAENKTLPVEQELESSQIKIEKKTESILKDTKPASKEVKFNVQDFRTQKVQKENNVTDAKAVTKIQNKHDYELSYKRTAQNQVQVTMDLASHVQENITSSSAQAASANGSTFQNMLQNAVTQNAPDFVKAGNIILKDNNQGQINMVLRPESLGNVKISLSVSDKVITGQITVHSEEAYQAMRESIDSLKQAFAQSGFETGNFNLNFAGNQNFAQSGNGSQQQNNSFGAERTYGDFVSVSQHKENESVSAYDKAEYSAVNIVA